MDLAQEYISLMTTMTATQTPKEDFADVLAEMDDLIFEVSHQVWRWSEKNREAWLNCEFSAPHYCNSYQPNIVRAAANRTGYEITDKEYMIEYS